MVTERSDKGKRGSQKVPMNNQKKSQGGTSRLGVWKERSKDIGIIWGDETDPGDEIQGT